MTEMNRREFGRAGVAGLAGFAVQQRPPAAAPSPADGRAYRYIHLDVFTDRRLQGNQLSFSRACSRAGRAGCTSGSA